MTRTIEFIFDFASPNAYLAWKVLPGIAARTGAHVKIVPCLLGGIFKATGNQAPMIAFGAIKGKLEYDMLEMRRFIARHGLEKFRMNPHFPINTLHLMRGFIASGTSQRYMEAVLAGMWEDGLNMADPETVASVLTGAALDTAEILQDAQTETVKQALAANTEAAVARGVFGIPTFFAGEEMFFGKDRLESLERHLAGGLA